MDFLRSFNITYSRMVDSSGRLFWVRWYPAAPGAKVFPHFHAFGHPVWEDSRDNFEGVGCIYRGLRWRRNRYPAPPGLSFRGEPAWYLDGLPAELLGAAETGERCGIPAIIPSGGCVLDGTAYLTLVTSTACQCEVADTIVGPLVTTACQCEIADTVVGPGPWIVSTACQCEIAVTPTSAPPGPVESVAAQSEGSVSTPSAHSVADQSEAAASAPSAHSVADQSEAAASAPSAHSVASQSETAVSTAPTPAVCAPFWNGDHPAPTITDAAFGDQVPDYIATDRWVVIMGGIYAWTWAGFPPACEPSTEHAILNFQALSPPYSENLQFLGYDPVTEISTWLAAAGTGQPIEGETVSVHAPM